MSDVGNANLPADMVDENRRLSQWAEGVAIVELCLRAGIVDEDTREELRDELQRVAKMLTGLIRSVDETK